MKPRRLEIAAVVTSEQGDTFAEGWFEEACDTFAIFDAFGSTEVMRWPDHDEEAQGRYQDIEDEICERTFEAVKGAISAAFVTAATEVLARERRRRR